MTASCTTQLSVLRGRVQALQHCGLKPSAEPTISVLHNSTAAVVLTACPGRLSLLASVVMTVCVPAAPAGTHRNTFTALLLNLVLVINQQ